MNQDLSKIRNWCFDNRRHLIPGDPGATSRDDAIFSGESLLQELKSPWELTLTEPVPEVVEFRPEDLAEKYFSAQSAERNSTTSGTGSVRISSVQLLKQTFARKYRIVPASSS